MFVGTCMYICIICICVCIYIYMYKKYFLCPFPLWLTTEYWIQFLELNTRTLLYLLIQTPNLFFPIPFGNHKLISCLWVCFCFLNVLFIKHAKCVDLPVSWVIVVWSRSSPPRGWSGALTVKVLSSTHWTTREFPGLTLE